MKELLSQVGNYQVFLDILLDVIELEAREEFQKVFSIESIRDLVKRRIRDFGGDFKRKFGNEYRWVNVRVLYDESLSTNEVILCFKEINDEKKQQLEHIELLKDSLNTMEKNMESRNIFFSNMSHDMRTPLNGIIGLSELAKSHINNPNEVARYLEKINSSSKQLLNLINDILDLSKADFGKYELNREEFLLKESIEESLILFEVDAKKMQKDFEVIYKIKHNHVIGDFNKIRQILNNIISNAFKYTRVGDKISLTIEEIKRDIYSNFRFEIKDTGFGMTKEFLERVFLPFERETRKKEMKEEIIEEKKLEDIDLCGKKILLVEDNELNCEIAHDLLTLTKAQVIVANNGEEAVKIFKNSRIGEINLILMDIQMPIMDGYMATKVIRELEREDSKNIEIIAMSANTFLDDIQKAKNCGMNDHIPKPIDIKKLMNILKALSQQMVDFDEK